MDNQSWLEGLERQNLGVSVDDVVLWPETPYHALQDRIREAQGVPDTDISAPNSRPHQIIESLKELVNNGSIPNNFTVLDICCGDGLILYAIKKAFPESICLGVDINRGVFFQDKEGTRVYRIPLQNLILKFPENRFDVTMMMNTFRSWPSAKLRDNEKDVPDQTTLWLSRSSKYSILTVHVKTLMYAEEMVDIGSGERDARMVRVKWMI